MAPAFRDLEKLAAWAAREEASCRNLRGINLMDEERALECVGACWRMRSQQHSSHRVAYILVVYIWLYTLVGFQSNINVQLHVQGYFCQLIHRRLITKSLVTVMSLSKLWKASG